MPYANVQRTSLLARHVRYTIKLGTLTTSWIRARAFSVTLRQITRAHALHESHVPTDMGLPKFQNLFKNENFWPFFYINSTIAYLLVQYRHMAQSRESGAWRVIRHAARDCTLCHSPAIAISLIGAKCLAKNEVCHEGKSSPKSITQRIPRPLSISCCSGGIVVTITRNMSSSTLDIFFRFQHEKWRWTMPMRAYVV